MKKNTYNNQHPGRGDDEGHEEAAVVPDSGELVVITGCRRARLRTYLWRAYSLRRRAVSGKPFVVGEENSFEYHDLTINHWRYILLWTKVDYF